MSVDASASCNHTQLVGTSMGVLIVLVIICTLLCTSDESLESRLGNFFFISINQSALTSAISYLTARKKSSVD